MQNFVRPFPKADRLASNLNDSFSQLSMFLDPKNEQIGHALLGMSSLMPFLATSNANKSNVSLSQWEIPGIHTLVHCFVFSICLCWKLLEMAQFLNNPVSVVGEADFDLGTSTPLGWGVDSFREAHGRLCRFPGQNLKQIFGGLRKTGQTENKSNCRKNQSYKARNASPIR